MVILDAHTHVGLNWFSPVETLLLEMNANGVAGAVLVQHAGAYDNDYLFECAQRFPGRFKVCTLIDPESENPEATLERLKNLGAAGLRLRPEWKFRTSSPDPYYMLRLAGRLGMVVSVLPRGAAELGEAAFQKALDACPDTHFQLEHLAGAGFARPPYTDYRSAMACAKWPNTSIKITGFGEFVPRPPVLPKAFPYAGMSIPPLYDLALEAFGPQRMTFASDYSSCSRREGYRNCLEAVRTYPAFQKNGVLEWILGKAAARIWSFGS